MVITSHQAGIKTRHFAARHGVRHVTGVDASPVSAMPHRAHTSQETQRRSARVSLGSSATRGLYRRLAAPSLFLPSKTPYSAPHQRRVANDQREVAWLVATRPSTFSTPRWKNPLSPSGWIGFTPSSPKTARAPS